jgi:hypothetical protein
MKTAIAMVLASLVGIASAQVPNTPKSLDRAAIAAGIAKVKPAILACGTKSTAKGIVKTAVKVAPSGSVTNTEIKQTPDAALGQCVANAMQTATFAKTEEGGAFSYPFVF